MRLSFELVADAIKEEKIEGGEAVYIPRDERFEPIKKFNFVANQLRGLVHKMVPSLRDHFDTTLGEFDSFRDIDQLYRDEIDIGDETIREKAARDYEKEELVNGLRAGEEEPPEVTNERKLAVDSLPIPDYFKQLIRKSFTPKNLLRHPLPKVLSRDRFAWMRDDEFARQTLAGVNPVVISCLKVSTRCESIICKE